MQNGNIFLIFAQNTDCSSKDKLYTSSSTRPVSENAHNYWFKHCILMYFNIVQPLVCKKVTRLHGASFWPGEFFW